MKVKELFWQGKHVSVLFRRKLNIINVLFTALGYSYIDIYEQTQIYRHVGTLLLTTRAVDDPLLIYGETGLEKNVFITFFLSLYSFLGAFEKLRKTALNSVMSECPSVCTEQLGPQWMEFFNGI